ncbi:N-acetylmannosaminyltransferase [hydrothermal vent metagenome]|uniref:N-acetylmannosaminyltransferase n=1 Tax=hydrothermal vent metagenome TaxID=652676 RepID=A0A3B0W847_9ZZZZ
MKNRIKLLNISIDNISLESLLTEYKSGVIVTPNLDHMVLLQKSEAMLNAYNSADYITVDSQILFLILKLLRKPVKEKISGSDFLPAYCQYHKNNPKIKIFLLGAAPGVAEKATENINKKIGRKIITGYHSPSMNFVNDDNECKQVIDIINNNSANVLVVGLGAPKQELWIEKHKNKFTNVHSFMALGATIDFESGMKPRSPKWMSTYGLEWLYRLLQEPGRLWKRYLITDTQFFLLILKDLLGLYKAPFMKNK